MAFFLLIQGISINCVQGKKQITYAWQIKSRNGKYLENEFRSFIL